jgi:hypothetical protein
MSDTLTYEIVRQMVKDFGPVVPRIRVFEVQPIPIYGPVRRHRRRRIQKKWLKRYGQKVVGYDRYLGDQIIVDERNGVAYCHPDIARKLHYRRKRNEA